MFNFGFGKWNVEYGNLFKFKMDIWGFCMGDWGIAIIHKDRNIRID